MFPTYLPSEGECLLNKWLLQKLGGRHYLVQKCIIYNYWVDEGKCLYEGKAKKTTTTLASLQFSTGMLEEEVLEEVLEKLEGKDHMLDSFD